MANIQNSENTKKDQVESFFGAPGPILKTEVLEVTTSSKKDPVRLMLIGPQWEKKSMINVPSKESGSDNM